MAEMKVRIVGKSPLLLHNGHLADPTNKIVQETKKVSSKKNKTIDDHIELGRLGFIGGFYLDESQQPCIPMEVMFACLKSGAKVSKNGKKIEAGAFIKEFTIPIQYEGPKSVDALWEDDRFVSKLMVKVQQSRVTRVRPKFNNWALEFTVEYMPDVIDGSEIVEALKNAGTLKGLCDNRPRYGRFDVVAFTEV